MVISMLGSVIMYMFTLIFMKSQLTSHITNWEFLYNLLAIFLVSWVPPFLFKLVMRYLFPPDYIKVMKGLQLANN